LPMTVKVTDLTVDAVAVACAWSCRWAEFAATAPRSHEDVPPSLPQPELKCGAATFEGVACSRTVASGTLPPFVHTLTFH
jgi:hypothetical protein